MKFKLIENYDYALDDLRSLVQEYIYDAIDDLGSSSLDKYITWYIEEFRGYDIDIDLLEKVVTDKYIEAIDTGKIKSNKTKLTSELKQYIESHKHLINDTDELMSHCPEHLQHELKLVIDIANLNESLLEELPSKFKQKLYDFIKQNHNLLDNDIDELYLLCPVGLKRDLADLLKSANIDVNTELINKFEFLVGTYNPQDLDRIIIDHDGQPGTTTDNVYYIITNWDKFDFPEYKELTEELLTEETYYKLNFNYVDSKHKQNRSDYVYIVTKNNASLSDLRSKVNNPDKHESVSDKWSEFFSRNSVTFSKFNKVSRADVMKDSSHVFNTSHSEQRKKSREAADNNVDLMNALRKFNDKYSDYYIHHPEKSETVFDPRINSFILYKGSNKYLPIGIHQIMHISNVDPRKLGDSGVCPNPILVWDQKTSSFIPRYLEVKVV